MSLLFKKPVGGVGCGKYSTAGLLVVWFAIVVPIELVKEISACVGLLLGTHSISFRSIFFCAYESLRGERKNTSTSPTISNPMENNFSVPCTEIMGNHL